MKTVMLVLALSFVAQAQAASCIGEGQLYPAKIVKIKKTYSECYVFVQDFYMDVNPICPLNDNRLITEGIEVGIKDGHDCAMNVGDTISGIVVDNGRNLTLAR